MKLLFFSETINCIIVAGGNEADVEVFTGDFGGKALPNLPKPFGNSSMFLHHGKILLCGGIKNDTIKRRCLQLENGDWKKHSVLNKKRFLHSAVTTSSASFVFGGSTNADTFEYLPKDSTKWMMGDTDIPGIGFFGGCAIAVKSEQEIWLIAGALGRHDKRILSFNVDDHTFEVLPFELNMGRYGPRCDFIPNTTKIMVTGGMDTRFERLDSTEIIDIEDGSVIMASPMKCKRVGHGMGIVTINGVNRLAVFGGSNGKGYDDTVEIYNTETQKWETTDLKLGEPKTAFGFLSVKLSDFNSKM